MGTKRTIGKNVAYEITKDKLTIEVDLKKTFGFSKSGKTVTIGTTNGNTKVHLDDGSEVIFGLNIYRYPTDEEAKSAPRTAIAR